MMGLMHRAAAFTMLSVQARELFDLSLWREIVWDVPGRLSRCAEPYQSRESTWVWSCSKRAVLMNGNDSQVIR